MHFRFIEFTMLTTMSFGKSHHGWRYAIVCAVLTGTPFNSNSATNLQSAPPLGLPPSQVLDHSDADKAKLGARLFADKRLSADGQVSCASCHIAEHAFADTVSRSSGFAGHKGTRNAPSLLNAAHLQSLFWDGRAADLGSQARAPFTNPIEHALPDEAALLRIVREDERYAADFLRLFDVPPTALRVQMIVEALVAFENTLLAGDSAFDRYVYGGDRGALTSAAVRGFELFRGRAACSDCHLIGSSSSLLTDELFHLAARGIPPAVTKELPALAARVVREKKVGSRALETLIASDPEVAALGRFVVTLVPADIGKFRTPSLRNVALTAPYMHDGSVATLAEAVDLELYSRGAVTRPIVLTRDERHDLLEFLRALSSPRGGTR